MRLLVDKFKYPTTKTLKILKRFDSFNMYYSKARFEVLISCDFSSFLTLGFFIKTYQ